MDLSTALAARAVESRRDVLGSEIEVSGSFVFAYQLARHAWSIIVPGEPGHYPEPLRSGELAQLSKQLGQPVVRLIVSDTGGVISYDLFETGELVEYFFGEEGESTDESNEYGLQAQRYLLTPYPDDDPEIQTAYFWSRRRQVTAEKIGSIWDFARQLLLEYDAFDPAIGSRDLLGEYSLRRGDRYQVQNPWFTLVLGAGRRVTSVPDLVGVNYFRFGD